MDGFNLKEIGILQCKRRYYIELYYTIGCFKEISNISDAEHISFLLGIPYHKYINIAFKKFNATMGKDREIYFTSLKDINNFADYLDSFLVMDKLR